MLKKTHHSKTESVRFHHPLTAALHPLLWRRRRGRIVLRLHGVLMPQEERKIVHAPPPRLVPAGRLRGGRGCLRRRPAHLDADTVAVAPRPQLLWIHGGGARQQQEGQIQPGSAQLAEVARVRGPGGLAGGGAAAAVHVQEGGEAGLPTAPTGGRGLGHLVFQLRLAFVFVLTPTNRFSSHSPLHFRAHLLYVFAESLLNQPRRLVLALPDAR